MQGIAAIRRNRTRQGRAADGSGSRTVVADTVRIRHYVPHHLSVLHDWSGGLAGDHRRHAHGHRKTHLPAGFRFLAQGLRRLLRHGCGLRHRHGVPVRHQLERACRADRLDPGPLARLRGVYRVSPGSHVLRHRHVRAQPGAAVVLPRFVLHGRARHHRVVVLDPRQQQLDAGAGGPRDRRRQDNPHRLDGDHLGIRLPYPLAAHAARGIPDHGHVRLRHGRLVSAAQGPSRAKAASCCIGAWRWRLC